MQQAKTLPFAKWILNILYKWWSVKTSLIQVIVVCMGALLFVPGALDITSRVDGMIVFVLKML